jgi:hypothetical protein
MKRTGTTYSKRITAADTAIYFKEFEDRARGFDQFSKFLEDLTKSRKVRLQKT